MKVGDLVKRFLESYQNGKIVDRAVYGIVIARGHRDLSMQVCFYTENYGTFWVPSERLEVVSASR